MAKIEPLRTSEFGLADHKYQTFNAVVSESMSQEDLEDAGYWVHIRNKVRAHDEIRVVAEDSSFMALMIVSYVDSFNIIVKTVWRAELEQPNPSELSSAQERYVVKPCGPLGWCLIDTETDTKIKTKIGSQSSAYRELEEHLRALAA